MILLLMNQFTRLYLSLAANIVCLIPQSQYSHTGHNYPQSTNLGWGALSLTCNSQYCPCSGSRQSDPFNRKRINLPSSYSHRLEKSSLDGIWAVLGRSHMPSPAPPGPIWGIPDISELLIDSSLSVSHKKCLWLLFCAPSLSNGLFYCYWNSHKMPT